MNCANWTKNPSCDEIEQSEQNGAGQREVSVCDVERTDEADGQFENNSIEKVKQEVQCSEHALGVQHTE